MSTIEESPRGSGTHRECTEANPPRALRHVKALADDSVVRLSRSQLYAQIPEYRTALRALEGEPWVQDIITKCQEESRVIPLGSNWPLDEFGVQLVVTGRGFQVEEIRAKNYYGSSFGGKKEDFQTKLKRYPLSRDKRLVELLASGFTKDQARSALKNYQKYGRSIPPETQKPETKQRINSQEDGSSLVLSQRLSITNCKCKLEKRASSHFEFAFLDVTGRQWHHRSMMMLKPRAESRAAAETLLNKAIVRSISQKERAFSPTNFRAYTLADADYAPRLFSEVGYADVIDSLPIEGLLKDISSSKKQDFLLGNLQISVGENEVHLSTKADGELKKIVDLVMLVDNPRDRLLTLIDRLKTCSACIPVQSEHPGFSRDAAAFIEDILNLSKSVYFKPTNDTACGDLVFKLSRAESGFIIETDSERGATCLRNFQKNQSPDPTTDSILVPGLQRAAQLARASWKALTRLGGLNAPKSSTKVIMPNSEQASKVIREIVDFFQNPYQRNDLIAVIAEETIPIERLFNRGIEFRLLYTYGGTDEPQIIAHFVKSSTNRVSGNISQGGEGEESHESILALMQQRFPELSQNQREAKATALLDEMYQNSQVLADGLIYELNVLQDYFDRHYPGKTSLKFRCLCVDCALCWNEKKEDFEWRLIESQSGAGVTGLEKAYPEAFRRYINSL